MAVSTFINESSLIGQKEGDINNMIVDMCRIIEIAADCCDSNVLLSKERLMRCSINPKGKTLKDLLAKKTGVIDKDTVDLFMGIIDKCITNIQLPTGSTYTYQGNDCSATTLAIAYEASKLLSKSDYLFLYSFPCSAFNFAYVVVNKSTEGMQKISNVTSPDGFASLLQRLGLRNVYDRKSKIPPTEEQSILTKNAEFVYTGKHESYQIKQSKVYYRKSKDQYWYLDSAHNDGEAHYEVFDGRFNFIGTLSFFEVNLDKIRAPRKKAAKARKLRMI